MTHPLYYLENGLTVIRWVRELHGDLLLGEEAAPELSIDDLDRLLRRDQWLVMLDGAGN